MPGDPDPVSSDPEVHSITDAATAHSEDMRQRMIKYSLAMGIRMVCIILIFVVDGWFKIIAVAGAVFLPWIAVVIANGSDMAEAHSDALLDDVATPEIEGSQQTAEDEPEEPVTVLQGELVDDEPDQEGATRQGSSDETPSTKAGNSGDERAAS